MMVWFWRFLALTLWIVVAGSFVDFAVYRMGLIAQREYPSGFASVALVTAIVATERSRKPQ